jgi:hypothetical protein
LDKKLAGTNLAEIVKENPRFVKCSFGLLRESVSITKHNYETISKTVDESETAKYNLSR